MASQSDRKAQSSARNQSADDRAALPFEPGRSRKKEGSKKGQSEAGDDNEAKRRSKKKRQKSQDIDAEPEISRSDISPGAQARVDAIRAANRKKAEAKAKKARQTSDGPDSDGSIPKEVSQRMLRRMAILSMTPIALGVGIFFLSYYLLSRQIVEFAPVVVLLTTMGCFGLGVVGLTYGMLSASWDEEPGSLVGLDEFKLNLGRMVDAWKESRASKT